MKNIISSILLFMPLILSAQAERIFEYPRFRWGVEVGFESFSGEAIKMPQIRENKSGYYDPAYRDDLYYCGFMYPRYNYTRYFVGVKPEYSLGHQFAVAAGLRFSYNNSVLNSDRDYFLWRMAEESLTTNYVRVTSLTQNNFYVGIPLELKVFTSRRDLRVRHYFKGGLVFNALLASTLTGNFQSDAMKEKYNSQITGQLEKPSTFGAQAFIGTGLKIGRMNHVFGNIEIQMPINLFKNQRASSFIYSSPASFVMITTINIPAGKQKLSYQYRSK